ncbi:ethylbenzene dehydrogenase-related protein [Rhodocyclus gracilis]|uniref:Cytochrome c-552/DMSO reductase-like haem-binding domain-containing protein n=1 Tax=Rhodocyclus tenuis TaxID=1066 RepID=A0A6L5JWJ7_RHOTE|nr:ethylbenzene dehydrogenase-related protein [Rhodocyclus gracilis]MQY51401.1 hypothetical protein [Rhodocyclus gracilis]
MRSPLPLALCVPLLVGSASVLAAPDWNKVPVRSISVFHAGATSFEWISTPSRHLGAGSVKKGQPCIVCHEMKGGLDFTAKRLAPREPDASALPATVSFPVSVQAAYDKDALYVRLAFTPPADAKPGSDTANDLKAALMLLDDKVPQAAQAGCWTSCHNDLRGMPNAANKGKYVAAGSFELLQWKSGKGASTLPAGVKVESARRGDTVTVTFTRTLSGPVAEGRSIPFGIAVHANRAAGRMHYVSLGYRLGLGAAGDVQAVKQ